MTCTWATAGSSPFGPCWSVGRSGSSRWGWTYVGDRGATWARSLLLLREFLLELAGAVHRRALTELVELEDLADLDLTLRAVFTVVPVSAAGLERHPLRPLDGLRHGLRFDDPVARDQLLRLREGPLDHGALSA